MTIKYYGTAYEKGLTLTVDLFDREGNPVISGIVMTETALNSAVYRSGNVLDAVILPPGAYVARIADSEGNFRGYDEILFNGVREVTLLELKFMSEKELMQLRDALGLDGDKMVARNGQLQKKSEYPYNELIDTTKI